jgi:hypothetical protein
MVQTVCAYCKEQTSRLYVLDLYHPDILYTCELIYSSIIIKLNVTNHQIILE